MSSGLSPEYVLALMRSGVRQTDIAKEHGVSRQYVNKLARDGGRESPITTVTQNMPWDIGPEYYENTLYQGIRLLGHHGVDPDSLAGTSRQKARAILRKLHHFDQVIDHDPAYPAMPGLTNSPGFAYLRRTPEDEDFLIRIRPGVRITPLGDRIWRMPEQWP